MGGEPWSKPKWSPWSQNGGNQSIVSQSIVSQSIASQTPTNTLEGARCCSQDDILLGRAADYSRGESAVCNLYVDGLPPDADCVYLYKLFSPLGKVLSVHAK